jgi:DeoR/GlpR family transcriptional regulator of sugar metabolism
MCREGIAVVDSARWGQFGLASFAAPEILNRVITDANAPANLVEQVKALGIKSTLMNILNCLTRGQEHGG